MKRYRISMEVDQEWLEAIQKFTNDVYGGEVCSWVSVDELLTNAPEEWECKECSSNSSMPKEHGCDYCQDFINTDYSGRVYLGRE